MDLETLLTYFDKEDTDVDYTFYSRKNDELILVARDEYDNPDLLAFVQVYNDGGVLGFTHDPDQEAVINVSAEHTDNLPVDIFRPID